MLMTEKPIRSITAHQLNCLHGTLGSNRAGKAFIRLPQLIQAQQTISFHLKLNNKSLYLQHHYVFNIWRHLTFKVHHSAGRAEGKDVHQLDKRHWWVRRDESREDISELKESHTTYSTRTNKAWTLSRLEDLEWLTQLWQCHRGSCKYQYRRFCNANWHHLYTSASILSMVATSGWVWPEDFSRSSKACGDTMRSF